METIPSYPQTDQIDPEIAKFLFEEHCAILVLEDLPVGSEFGIDLTAYRIGDKFKGIKLIPPGLHFVYASACDNRDNRLGPRCGFFYNFQPRELLLKKWSPIDEEFIMSDHVLTEEQDRYRANLRELGHYLGPYSFSSYRTYCSLTNKLTPTVVESLMPECKLIRSIPYLVKGSHTPGPMKNPRLRYSRLNPCPEAGDELLPELVAEPTARIRFTRISFDHRDSNQPIGHDRITQYCLDSTMKLEQIFVGSSGKELLMGEFQFAFLIFLLCQVFECFEHWKRLLNLICLADSGISDFPHFYVDFVGSFLSQMEQVPAELFEDIIASENLVRTLLDTFFQNVKHRCDDSSDLGKHASDLKRYLQEKFNWQFDIEAEDEQPVTVYT